MRLIAAIAIALCIIGWPFLLGLVVVWRFTKPRHDPLDNRADLDPFAAPEGGAGLYPGRRRKQHGALNTQGRQRDHG